MGSNGCRRDVEEENTNTFWTHIKELTRSRKESTALLSRQESAEQKGSGGSRIANRVASYRFVGISQKLQNQTH